MMILLIGIGVILFVVGVWFLYRGYLSTPNANQIVALTEYSKLETELVLSKEVEKKLRQDLDTLRGELSAVKDVAGRQASLRQTEDDTLTLRRDYEQRLAQSMAMVDSLKFSQDSLRDQLREAVNKVHTLEENIDNLQREQQRPIEQLTAEKKSLQTQVEESLAQIHRLETDLRNALREGEERLSEVNSENERLKLSAQSLKAQAEEKAARVQQLEGDVTATIDALRQDREGLLEGKAEFEQSLRKFKEVNAQLMEKEKHIQYELAKSRAQSMGMEKICMDLKIQFDKLQKEAENLRSQPHLSQAEKTLKERRV